MSPFYPSELADGGYDVIDHRDVDPRIGTLDEFDALVAALHARASGADRHRAQPLLEPAPVVPGRPRGRAGIACPGALPLLRRHRPGRRRAAPTGARCSAAGPGRGCPAGSGTCTRSPRSSPT
ncbi:MAG: alpha-amylase family glycosyl hydrolase [Micropruina sp.]